MRMQFYRSVSQAFSKTVVVLAGLSVILSPLQPAFVLAVDPDVTLFSDTFEQSGSGLTNKWDDYGGSSNDPSRDAGMGVGGTRGLTFFADLTQDPDERAQRSVAIQGYSTIKIEYSRSIASFELGDSFQARYSFDEGAFIDLETLTANQAHIVASFTLANLDRNTKLTIRFFVNGDEINDRVVIDDLVVKGSGAPLFYDGFESGNFTSGGWSVEESPSVVTDDDDAWTDNNTSTAGRAANLEASSGTNPDEAIVKAFPTTGYQNIKVRYAREASSLEPADNDNFKFYYSTDGSTWITPATETINDDDGYESISFGSLSGANNNPNFKIRFEVNGNNSNDEVFIDDVVIWGDTYVPPVIGSIAGMKFNDLNGNGIKEEGEPGLAGWTINLTGPSNSSAVTDGSGSYSFSSLADGSYTVCETMQATWTQTFPTSGPACAGSTLGYSVTISGGNAVTGKDFGNVQYAKITLDKVTDPAGNTEEFSFSLSGPISGNTSLSDTDTAHQFLNLIEGSYTLTEAPVEGWVLTGKSCEVDNSGVENGLIFSVSAGASISCVFTNTKNGSVTITKYASPNGSFQFQLNSFEPVSLSDGQSYTFDNLPPGNYSMSEIVPEGWSGQQNMDCDNEVNGTNSVNFNLNAGENITCVANNTEFAVVSGKKFHDTNADGSGLGENGLQGWTISLRKSVMVEAQVPVECVGEQNEPCFETQVQQQWQEASEPAVTDEEGNYSFSNLEPGDYRVCEVMQEGWYQSYPTEGLDCDGSFGYEFSLSAGQTVVGRDFGNYQKASLSGQKFNDENGNGLWDEEESGLNNWTIELWSGEQMVGEDVTEENGSYSFSNLNPGVYTVKEVNQLGWFQTYPLAPNYHTVSLSSNDELGSINFGNSEAVSVSGYKWYDQNGDGVWQINEVALAGWEIKATQGEVVKTTETDGSGLYSFVFTPDEMGEWVISETQSSFWNQTFPIEPNTYTVEVTSVGASFVNKNFGNQRKALITGSVWHDFDRDGVRDESESLQEPGVEGWNVYLNEMVSQEVPCPEEQEVPCFETEMVQLSLVSTDGAGNFNLPIEHAGNYRITQETRSLWKQTSIDSFFDVFVDAEDFGPGQIYQYDGLNRPIRFGNLRYENVYGAKVAPVNGNSNATDPAVVIEPATILVASGLGNSTIQFVSETMITRSDNQALNILALAFGTFGESLVTGLENGFVAASVLQWGLPDLTLEFNPPITVSLYVDPFLNGKTLNIVRSSSATGGWTNEGIASPTCVVVDAHCTFQATMASYYAATYQPGATNPGGGDPGGGGPIIPNTPVDNGGGNGGGGGGGGNIPVPPTDNGGNGGGTSGGEQGGGTSSNGSGETGPVAFAGLAGGSEDTSTGDLTGGEGGELELASLGNSLPTDETGFLANLLDMFGFGGWMFWLLLIILALIIWYWLRRRNRRN